MDEQLVGGEESEAKEDDDYGKKIWWMGETCEGSPPGRCLIPEVLLMFLD